MKSPLPLLGERIHAVAKCRHYRQELQRFLHKSGALRVFAIEREGDVTEEPDQYPVRHRTYAIRLPRYSAVL
ncbi:hypothetical protein D3C86_2215510 [compost metagenome]